MSTDRDHLDAETVAAWLDGGLDAASLAAAEAHASNCERCQVLLATVVKTEPLGTRHDAPGTTRIWRWWLAPIAATAAAVTLWMVVPQERLQQKAMAPSAEVAAPAAEPPAPAAPERRSPSEGGQFSESTRPAEAPQGAREKPRAAQGKLGATAANTVDAVGAKAGTPTPRPGAADRRDKQEVARLEAEPARVPAAPPPAAAAPKEEAAAGRDAAFTQLRKQVGPLEIVSPDPRFRWRAMPAGIERSEDGGRVWLPVRLAQGEVITAGASPAPLAAWLVGQRGLVLLASDGTNFTRIPFPAQVDLIAVSSPELRIATVFTADGRIFHTENAGRTWRQQ